TNSNPNNIDYVIPANDDASKSIDLILGTVCDAITEGLQERKVEKADEKAAPENGEAPRRGGERRRVTRREAAPAEANEAAEESAE
ncbi:MAG: uS2 family ribosomal protein, partial [Duncaniella sp.]|nr:uS2 family ribosomal protein [Duncaniella sp.]